MSEDTDSLEDVVLNGQFRLDRCLGRGGYGAVYEAEQLSMGRRCAVKLMLASMAEDERAQQRFEREARATATLHHPNTLSVIDFGVDTERDLLFLAMEYLEGQTVLEHLEGQGLFSLEDTVHIIGQAALSLQGAHDANVIHRDIKPSNIFLAPQPQDPLFVKIIDFGIAMTLEGPGSAVERLTATGTMVGTPCYMTPEQINDQSVDGRTDQYALAVVVYRMISGRYPIAGRNPMDIIMGHLKKEPVSLSTLLPGVEGLDAVDRVLLRALEKSPARRFPRIVDFADALRVAATGQLWERPEQATVPLGHIEGLAEDLALALTAQATTPQPTRREMLQHAENARGDMSTRPDTPSLLNSEASPRPAHGTQLMFAVTPDMIPPESTQQLPSPDGSASSPQVHLPGEQVLVVEREPRRPANHTPRLRDSAPEPSAPSAPPTPAPTEIAAPEVSPPKNALLVPEPAVVAPREKASNASLFLVLMVLSVLVLGIVAVAAFMTLR